jgi:hypothetical protein
MPWKRLQNKPDLSVPVWPELSAGQKSAALAKGWPQRVKGAFGFAAILALAMAAVAYQPSPSGSPPWRSLLSFALCAVFLFAYLRLDTSALPRPLVALIGFTTIITTQINLMTCVAELVLTKPLRAGVFEAALVLFALATGTIWALRINLQRGAFLATCAVTAAVLWLPWLMFNSEPVEVVVLGLICGVAGAQLRWIAAERAYDVYRREVLWPRLWRDSIELEVELELLALSAAVNQPIEPFALDDDRYEGSIVQLADALAEHRAQSPATDSEREARRERRQG